LTPLGWRGLRAVAVTLYVALGWLAIVAMPQFVRGVPLAHHPAVHRRDPLHGRSGRVAPPAPGPVPGRIRLPRDLARHGDQRGAVSLRGHLGPAAGALTQASRRSGGG